MRLTKVPLTAIDFTDERYRIALVGELSSLRKSISAIGLIEPPLLRVTPEGKRMIIVQGFRRLQVVRELGWEEFPACVLDAEEADERRCLWISYHSMAQARPLALCEKAQWAFRLMGIGRYSPAEIVQWFLPMVDLPAQRAVLDQLLALARWPAELKEQASAAGLANQVLLEAGEFSHDEAATLIRFLAANRWSASRQREVFGYLLDLAARDGKTIGDIVREAQGCDPQPESAPPLPQRAERIRQYLRRRRLPSLTAVEDRYFRIRRSLRLPPQVVLQEPPDFEDNRYRLQFTFSSRREYEEALAVLERIREQAEFEELFRLP